jgi:sigma-B regulation protein RsbU (phosphoserine phosphatase)
MAKRLDPLIREELVVRRRKLQNALASPRKDVQIENLIREVDAALERMEEGTYGLCEECSDPIETDRLIADPLTRLCLDHLTAAQQEALEEDLELASRIQGGLLPQGDIQAAGWEASYHYEPARIVSGDYCDLLHLEDGLHFVLGDVSGKGVSAAMLMAHLHATFRALVSLGLPLEQVMERASRMFCESTLPTHFATLVCGKARSSGEVELSIAGHNPVLSIQGSEVTKIEATGLPLGMFCDEHFSICKTRLNPGDSIILYTDGFSEAVDASGQEYGIERLANSLRANSSLTSQELIDACLADQRSFRSDPSTADDLTIMVIRRVESSLHKVK